MSPKNAAPGPLKEGIQIRILLTAVCNPEFAIYVLHSPYYRRLKKRVVVNPHVALTSETTMFSCTLTGTQTMLQELRLAT